MIWIRAAVAALIHALSSQLKEFSQLCICSSFLVERLLKYGLPGQLIVNANGKGGGALLGGIQGNILSESVIDVNGSWGEGDSGQQLLTSSLICSCQKNYLAN